MTKLFFILIAGWMLLFVTSERLWAQYETESKEFYLKQDQNQLNSLHFNEHDTVKLAGHWQFFEHQWVTNAKQGKDPISVTLPESFGKTVGQNQTYGSYVGHFKIPPAYIGRRIGILIPNQPSAYRIYLNGDVLVRLGEISENPQQQVTEKAARIAYFVPESEYFTLTIQAASTNRLHGGFENPMKIGLARNINRQFQSQMMSVAMVCGAVLSVGVFTILFSLFRGLVARNSKSIFVFGIFIIFLALHNLFSAPYAYTVFTTIEWLWGTRLEYLFSFAAALFFLTYMYWSNPRYLHRTVYLIALFLLLLNIIVTLVAGPEIFEILALYSSAFTAVILLNFIYGFYQTVQQGLPYSRLNLLAVIFLCVTFSNDILLMMNLIDSINLSFLSTSLYALLIMFQQSRNYAHQTYHTEQLNHELMLLNSSLDLKVKERTAQLHDLNEKLELQNKIDALTGAYNRRALNNEIQRVFDIVQHQHRSVYFAMLDVDYFKQYNDHYGHLKGDEVLQGIVDCLKHILPEQAFLARYGGEEFAILLHNVEFKQAEKLFEQVLDAIRSLNYEHAYRLDQKKYITVSMGVAYIYGSSIYDDIHSLMKAADAQLYAAKTAGRDQMKIALK